MKLKHLFLILLAFCTVFFLTGCDSGGGSSSDSDGDGDGGDSGTVIYKVTDLADHTGISDFSANNGTITYTSGGYVHTDTVTLTIDNDNKTYSLHEVETCTDPGIPDVGCTFSGTWTVSGSTINVTNTLTTYDNGDPDDTTPWDDTFTITSDTTINVWGWVLTKQ